MNGLVDATMDLYACADGVDTLNSAENVRKAQVLRGSCIDIVRVLDPKLVL